MAGLQPIDGIRPVAPSPSLLTVASELQAPRQKSPNQDPGATLPEGAMDPGAFWRSGVAWRSAACFGGGHIWPHVPSSDPDVVKAEPDEMTNPEFRPYMVYVPWACEWVVPGTEGDYGYKDDAIAQLEAVTAYNVAHELWTGAGDASAADGGVNPTLMSVGTSVGVTEAANPIWAMGRLIDAYHDCMQTGGAILHVPAILIPYLQNQGVISKVGSALRTSLDVGVSPGPGYPTEGAWGPDGEVAGEGEAFMYVTGPVEYALTAPKLLPEGEAPFFDRRRNQYELWAERKAIHRFDTCCVFAVLTKIPNAPTMAS